MGSLDKISKATWFDLPETFGRERKTALRALDFLRSEGCIFPGELENQDEGRDGHIAGELKAGWGSYDEVL
jgi:hypothetical protein